LLRSSSPSFSSVMCGHTSGHCASEFAKGLPARRPLCADSGRSSDSENSAASDPLRSFDLTSSGARTGHSPATYVAAPDAT
jgi:hypothetical protein